MAILLVSALYALITVWPKNKIKLKLTEKVKAEVFFGDLFSAKEIIVIPVNEYFDTIVELSVGHQRSL